MSAKEFRLSIAMDILDSMNKDDDKDQSDLPLPNIYRVAKVMQEYFDRDGYEDLLIEEGYKWRPTEEYWVAHMLDIKDAMRRSRKRYFDFVRKQGEFKGEWKFCDKREYEALLKRGHADIATRVDTQNTKIEDGRKRWQLTVPPIPEVPRLTYTE